MCTTCGCSSQPIEHEHKHDDFPALMKDTTSARLLSVERDLLEKNTRYASINRAKLKKNNTLALNLVSSPGSGKTTLLTETIQHLNQPANIAVIEGDQQTENDARRIRQTGVEAIQINTGKGCHLDAHAVGHALSDLPSSDIRYLFIENVGNLVCPAAFDLGEHAKVLVLSVTEGDDKPLKYPDMFAAASLLLINKIDLLPYVNFDVARCVEFARRINPDIQIIELSATSGAGMHEWLAWLTTYNTHQTQRSPDTADESHFGQTGKNGNTGLCAHDH